MEIMEVLPAMRKSRVWPEDEWLREGRGDGRTENPDTERPRR